MKLKFSGRREPKARVEGASGKRKRAFLFYLLIVCLLTGLVAAQNQNPQVPRGGTASFVQSGDVLPTTGGAEIAAPDGRVVVSFAYPTGGNSNGWALSANASSYNAAPTYTVSAPVDAPIAAGYEVRTSTYYRGGSARFDVVDAASPTPTPEVTTQPSPTPSSNPSPSPDPSPSPTYDPGPTPGATPTATPTAEPRDPQPDAALRAIEQAQFVGGDVHDPTGQRQSATSSTVPHLAATYIVRIENDGGSGPAFQVMGTAGKPGWSVKYFDDKTGADITGPVTGGGWSLPEPLVGPAWRDLRVEVTPSHTVEDGASEAVTLTVAADEAHMDVVKAITQRIRALEKVQYRTIMDQEWHDVPPPNSQGYSVLTAQGWNTVFRAVRAPGVAKWPELPESPFLLPRWEQSGGEQDGQSINDDSYGLTYSKVTAGLITMKVSCGDSLSFKIKVRPNYRLSNLSTSRGLIRLRTAGDEGRCVLTAHVDDWDLEPLTGATVHFSAHFVQGGAQARLVNSSGVASTVAVTDASGKASLTLVPTTQAGDVEVTARIEGPGGEVWAKAPYPQYVTVAQPVDSN